MSTFSEQFAAFAIARGGTLRTGPQPPKPVREKPSSIGRTVPVQKAEPADPYIDYTDDYTVWKQGQ